MIQVNSLIFPAPKNSSLDQIKNQLIFIPKRSQQCTDKRVKLDSISSASTARSIRSCIAPATFKIAVRLKQETIPCLFIKGKIQKKIIIYFHANGQDLGTGYEFMRQIQKWNNYSFLGVQYPGYSIYKGQPSAKKILQDSQSVVEYLKVSGYSLQNMLVLGRSIGSGPALHVASKYKVGSLVLISPFFSLRQTIKDMLGTIISQIVVQRFQNGNIANQVDSPCLIIHGIQDKVISHQHSIKLSVRFKGYSQLKLIQDMTHSSFHYQRDFLTHLDSFLKKIQF